MRDADGSVIVEAVMDDKKAMKELQRLNQAINKSTEEISKSETKHNAIAEQLREATEQADVTRKEISNLKDQLSSVFSPDKAAAEEVRAIEKELEELNKEAAELKFNYAAAKQEAAAMSGTASEEDFYAQIVKINEVRSAWLKVYAEISKKQERSGELQREIGAKLNSGPQLRESLAQQEKLLADLEQAIQRLEAQDEKVLETLAAQTKELEKQQADVGEIERRLVEASSNGLKKFKEGMDAAGESSKLSLKRLLKYGIGIRSLFVLANRLRTGIVESVKAFSEHDEETGNTINNLKSALSGLKVSWGAAFAPILNAVAPLLQTLISWLERAAYAVQRFFAVLSGKSSIKKAVANNNALSESLGGAGSAAEEAKKQLAGFDEITRLEAQDSSSGGGGASADELEFMEETISEDMANTMKTIRDIALAVGAAVAGWAVSKMFGADMKQATGIALSLGGAILLVTGFMDAWSEGLDLSNLLQTLSGAALLAGGLALAFGKTGGAIGLLIGGISLLVLGFKDWIETGELSTEAFIAIETGILALGAAISLLTGGWIPLLIAAVAGIVFAVATHWDEIKNKTIETWRATKENTLEQLGMMKDYAVERFNDMREGINKVMDKTKELVKAAVEKLKGFFDFQWQLPHIPMPHINVQWDDTSNSAIAKLLGITAIPRFSISWYARGGIVDGATLIGAGEAGKEAIIPLERHTEWISLVADKLAERLGMGDMYEGLKEVAASIDRIPSALERISQSIINIPKPAMAMGAVVPPRALGTESYGYGESGPVLEALNALIAQLQSENKSEDMPEFNLYIDGKQVEAVVTRRQRERARSTGV